MMIYQKVSIWERIEVRENMKIGIIGQGYVGTAIKVGFEPYYELETYDKYNKSKTT